jgi:hypothetical protein
MSMDEFTATHLIACAGAAVDSKCASAMQAFLTAQTSDIYRFVMSHWLQEDQLRRASLVWVVDDTAYLSAVDFALANQIAILVPEANAAMKHICVAADCGMYYRDTADAQLCLDFLLSNDSIRRRMGANGQAYARNRLAKACAR